MTTGKTKISRAMLKRLRWEPGAFRDVANQITRVFLDTPSAIWIDDLLNDFRSTTHPRLVCFSWRKLVSSGVIQRTLRFRKSIVPGCVGQSVGEFELVSREIGEAFILANGTVRQTEMVHASNRAGDLMTYSII